MTAIIYASNKINALHCMQHDSSCGFILLSLDQICGSHISAIIVDRNLILFWPLGILHKNHLCMQRKCMHCHALIHLHLHLFHVYSMHWKNLWTSYLRNHSRYKFEIFFDCFVFISTIIYPINKIHVLHCMQDNFLHLHLHLFHALEQICGHHISANIVDKNLIFF